MRRHRSSQHWEGAQLAVALAVAYLGGSAQAAAQPKQIQWLTDPAEAVAIARKTTRPLMFYTAGRTQDRPNLDAHRRALSDRRVLRLAQRFVPVQLRAGQHKDMVAGWDVGGWTIVFTAPDGTKIDAIYPTNPETLAQKMHLVFNQFRTDLFERDIRIAIDLPQATSQQVLDALQRVSDLCILAADQAIIRLLDRAPPADVRARAYQVLAKLSTPAAARKLMEAARRDEDAAAALLLCTPAAAEIMLEDFGRGDPEQHLRIYRALCRICDIRSVKPDRFWSGDNERIQSREIERVRGAVRHYAKRWRIEYEYR